MLESRERSAAPGDIITVCGHEALHPCPPVSSSPPQKHVSQATRGGWGQEGAECPRPSVHLQPSRLQRAEGLRPGGAGGGGCTWLCPRAHSCAHVKGTQRSLFPLTYLQRQLSTGLEGREPSTDGDWNTQRTAGRTDRQTDSSPRDPEESPSASSPPFPLQVLPQRLLGKEPAGMFHLGSEAPSDRVGVLLTWG